MSHLCCPADTHSEKLCYEKRFKIRQDAARGDVAAQTLWGQILLDGDPEVGQAPDLSGARDWFRIAAEAQFPPALNMLGRCLERGWGGAVDWPGAVRAYEAAVVLGDDWARYNLANMVLRGRGVLQDRARAFLLFEQAARRGHAKSMNLVARCLEEGWGCLPNRAAAAAWYLRSAEQGDYRGQHNYAVLLAERGALEEAFQWWGRALSEATPDIREAMRAILQHLSQHKEAQNLLRRLAE